MDNDSADQCFALLLAASVGRSSGVCSGFSADQLAGFTDWTGLIALALAHGMGGLLCEHLLASAGNGVTEDIADAARTHIGFLRSAHATGIAELHGLLTLLNNAGIVAVPFKGPVFAQQFYPDPALRRFTDLDILINAMDAEAAHTLLVAQGYRSQHQDLRPRHLRAYWHYNGQDVLHAPDRLPVEPHWLFGQRTLATYLNMSGFLSRAVPIVLGEQTILALSPEDSLIATCFHGSKDEWQSLRTVADIAAILSCAPGLDWEDVRQRAAVGGIGRMVLIGLQLAANLLQAKLPVAVTRQLASDCIATALAEQAAARLFVADAPIRSVFELSAFRWRMRERFPDRLRYAAATLFTPRVRQFRTLDLPDPLCFLYPAVKIMQDYVALPIKQRLPRAVTS